MDEGYYLSAYIDIDPINHLYNFNIRHDQNFALWLYKKEKLELVRYWEIERFSGLKGHYTSFYDYDSAVAFIEKCLQGEGISFKDLRDIWGSPRLKDTSVNSMNLNNILSDHSLSHLYSALLMNTELFYQETIIGFAVDGGPDVCIDKNALHKKYYSGCVSRQGDIEVFPIYSPGMIWDYLKNRTHLREGTLMALATASKSEFYMDEIPTILIDDYESLQKAYEYLDDLCGKVESLTEADLGARFNYYDEKFSEEDNKISMLAKIVQSISLKVMYHNIEMVQQKYDLDLTKCVLAMSGGYALNCPTNSDLMVKYSFRKFIAPPCVNDSGLSLGIGLRAAYSLIDGKMNFKFKNAYYGVADSTLEVKFKEYEDYIQNVEPLSYEQIARDIAENPIVWFDGNAEIGPRALGNRSIFADPSSEKSKDILNDVKQRQWWRPVAPIVLAEEADHWFEMCCNDIPYMLHTCNIRKDKRNIVPAVAHMDGTARVQTVSRDDNNTVYEIIKHFNELKGIPIICNTSLNDKGEPVINSISEVFNFALRKRFYVIYINQHRIELKNHESYITKTVQKRQHSDMFIVTDREEKLKLMNPYGISKEILGFATLLDDIGLENYDLTKKESVNRLTRIVSIFQKMTKIDVDTILGD